MNMYLHNSYWCCFPWNISVDTSWSRVNEQKKNWSAFLSLQLVEFVWRVLILLQKKKKKGVEKKYLLSVLIQVFSFIQLYYVWFLFSSHKNISNFSNLFFIILFIFRVRVCCVWIPVMVRFIIANIRCYRCRSAGLRVGWFLHWFCEVQLHLIGEQSTI